MTRFGSALEEARYRELQLLEFAGLIRGLRPHPRYVLFAKTDCLPAIVYTADAEYVEKARLIAEDTKLLRFSRDGKRQTPTETQAVKLRMAVFRHLFPQIELRVEYREQTRRPAPRAPSRRKR